MTSTARHKLESGSLSRAAQLQQQGLGDVDLNAFKLQLKGAIGINAASAVINADLNRTVEGGSTLTVTIADDERKVLRSGLLSQRTDVNLDGLWFRLVQVRKSGHELTLTFEDRAIAILRTYTSKLGPVSRNQVTRAQFILRMIKEVREISIPTFIPELLAVQPVEETSDTKGYKPYQETQAISKEAGTTNELQTGGAVPKANQARVGIDATLTSKGQPLTPQQITNANTILSVAKSRKANRKVMVTAIMVAIQETNITNLSDAQSPGIRSGVFQQDPRYWPASGDVGKDAAAFIDHAIGIDRTYPNLAYYDLGERVQQSGQPLLYAQWRTEAEHIVSAFGEPTSGVAAGTTDWQQLSGGSDYFFYRGIPPQQGSNIWKPEDSWTAIQRLATDVAWRAFFVSGKFYYLTEDYLFRTSIAHTLTEASPGVQEINFDYDQGKRHAIVTIPVLMKRWAAPPGTIVALRGMGPANGRWLVSEVSRSLFSEEGTVTLKKPNPLLPEPAQSNLTSGVSYTQTGPTGQQFRTPSSLVNPIPKGQGGNVGAQHNTDGLNDYPAYDFFAKPNTPILAPESGKITRLSGHDPALGPIAPNGLPGGAEAAGGPLGWSIYLEGDESGTTYYMTHMATRNVIAGTHVQGGQVIGTVADYDRWGRQSHVHVGVHGGSVTAEMLANALQATDQ